MGNRYIGSTEDRINKWMRMCLQWQFDIRRGIAKSPTHYFEKYHVGKYPKRFFSDLKDCVVDRDYVIDKMNFVSEDRMIRDRNLGIKSNRVIIKQVDVPDFSVVHKPSGERISDDTIVKTVSRPKYDLSKVSSEALCDELNRRLLG